MESLQPSPDITHDRYYAQYGEGHDGILRCRECRTLHTAKDLFDRGSCPNCGHRKMTEIVALTFWEWLKIRVGYIDFPRRKEFLREFQRS